MDNTPDVVSAASEHSPYKQGLLRLLAGGEKEIQAGKGYDLDIVLAEAETLLKEMQR
jgi:hypothetical protein